MILAGWSAYPRQLDFAALPGDRRRGRRLPDGRHGALRGARGRRPAPQPGAVRRRGHHDDPQDDRRRPRRDDPLPRGARQEDRLGGVPRPAGRPARAHHRRQGGGAADRRRPRRSASASSARWTAPGPSPRSCSAPAAACQRADRRHRRAPRARATCASPSSTASRPRTACTRSASPSTATPSRSIPGRPAVSSGLRIGTPALATRGLQVEDFVEVGRIIAAALTPATGSRTRAGDWPSAPRRSPSAIPLYAQLAATV